MLPDVYPRGRALLGLILLYVGLDFANPMMPGAFEFEPAESVDGLRAERGRTGPPAIIAASKPAQAGVAVDSTVRRPVARAPRPTALTKLVVPVQRAHLPGSSDSASAGDDH